MAAAALQPAAALNLGGVSATVRTNPENADTKLIGNVILIEVASTLVTGAEQHPASALIQAEASGRCGHSLAPAPAPNEPMRREVNSKASAPVLT
jgi:hypothetical protein